MINDSAIVDYYCDKCKKFTKHILTAIFDEGNPKVVAGLSTINPHTQSIVPNKVINECTICGAIEQHEN